MRYLLALLLPPVAVFLCAKPIQGLLNIFLCLFFWVPGIVHALFVVHTHLAEKRNKELISAIKDTHGAN
ncbi:MAG: YqaE/Pmp3 family membrane protein [Pseudohongiellaceae bacterium]